MTELKRFSISPLISKPSFLEIIGPADLLPESRYLLVQTPFFGFFLSRHLIAICSIEWLKARFFRAQKGVSLMMERPVFPPLSVFLFFYPLSVESDIFIDFLLLPIINLFNPQRGNPLSEPRSTPFQPSQAFRMRRQMTVFLKHCTASSPPPDFSFRRV